LNLADRDDEEEKRTRKAPPFLYALLLIVEGDLQTVLFDSKRSQAKLSQSLRCGPRRRKGSLLSVILVGFFLRTTSLHFMCRIYTKGSFCNDNVIETIFSK